MGKFRSHTIKEYLEILAAKQPVPGGGSAAALTAACGAALLSMVVRYSRGKGASQQVELRLESLIKKTEKIRRRLVFLIDLDSEAYLKVVETRRAAASRKKAALKQASAVPKEVCRLCYEAVNLTPFLVKKGNKHLVSDIEVAVELLYAAYKSSMINIAINQANN